MSDDHARPIPQRGGSDARGGDDVFVVDTRRGARGAGRGGRAAPPPPPPPAASAPVAPPAAATAYDELGRPVRAGGPPSGGGRPPAAPRSPRGPRRPGGARRGLRAVVLLLVLWLVFLVATPAHAWTRVTREDTTPGGDRPGAADGHTYLLVGSDSRQGLTAEEQKELGVGKDDGGRRTDSIILVHTPSGSGKPVVVSIPRDSYLEIPGEGKNKVNAAFAIGGPKLLAETLELATGLPIDGYVEIGFGGFASVVDSLGGVEMCVPRDIEDAKAHIDLKKGCQTLSGKNALGYVRARYSDPKGDLGRAERQRQFLGAVMKQAATPSTVLVPWRWWGFTHAAASGVVVGEDTSLVDTYRILTTMRKVSGGEALGLVVPISSTNASTSAGSSVLWDDERADAFFAMLREGEPLTEPPPGTDGEPAG